MEPKPESVLFVDVSGSTAYFDRHGEIAGRAMLDRCFGIVVPEVENRGGRVVKFLGDGMLAVFDRPSDMVAAARAAHRKLEDESGDALSADRVLLHSGGDVGPLAHDAGGDVFGDAVNVAARVQHLAGRDQIYVTAEVIRALSDAEREGTRRIGTFPLRGKEREVEVHEVLWRVGGATVLVSRSTVTPVARLSLTFGSKTVEVPPGANRLTIGRTGGNDLVIDDAAVSREHAEIVRRRGLLYFVDHSTNGTFLHPADGSPHHLHHDEYLLEGSGTLALGHPDGPPIEYRVTFEILTE